MMGIDVLWFGQTANLIHNVQDDFASIRGILCSLLERYCADVRFLFDYEAKILTL